MVRTMKTRDVLGALMKIGCVFPHNEIGNDPEDIKAFAIGAEELGCDHMLIYDHV